MGSSRPVLALMIGVAVVLGACGNASEPPTAAAELILPTRALVVEDTPPPANTSPAPASEQSQPTAAAAATSRGPDLEASDPEGVKLDSGSLQLVEFFRFT